MPRSVHSGEAEHPTIQNRVTPWSEGVMFELQVSFCVVEKKKIASNGSVLVLILECKNGKRMGMPAKDKV